jgi:hypothetical protein
MDTPEKTQQKKQKQQDTTLSHTTHISALSSSKYLLEDLTIPKLQGRQKKLTETELAEMRLQETSIFKHIIEKLKLKQSRIKKELLERSDMHLSLHFVYIPVCVGSNPDWTLCSVVLVSKFWNELRPIPN